MKTLNEFLTEATRRPRNFKAMDPNVARHMASAHFKKPFRSHSAALKALQSLPVDVQHSLDKKSARLKAKKIADRRQAKEQKERMARLERENEARKRTDAYAAQARARSHDRDRDDGFDWGAAAIGVGVGSWLGSS